MKALFAKNLRALYPADEAGEALVQKLGQGEMVEVEIRRKRNLQHHRLYWALLSLVWQQLDDRAKYPTVEELHAEVKIVTGHYDRRDIVVEGKRYPVLVPKSISFAAMDQDEFEQFFTRVCDWVAKDVLPGVRQEDLRHELSVMVGAEIGSD